MGFLPGLSGEQERALRRKRLGTRDALRAYLKKHGPDNPVIASLPAAARAELLYSPTDVSLATAQKVAKIFQKELRWAQKEGSRLRESQGLGAGRGPGPKRLILVGSARREKPRSKDVDLLLVLPGAPPPEGSPAARSSPLQGVTLAGGAEILATYAQGPRRRAFILKLGRARHRVDLFLAYDSEMPYALYHFTGNAIHEIRVRAHAKRLGWRLNQYGLFYASSGRRVRGSGGIKTEDDLARFLGVTPKPPRERDEPGKLS